MNAPSVPRPNALYPLIEELPVGTELTKVGDRRWGATGFNPTNGSARFRPVRDTSGQVVATAYLASDAETALSEALLRGVSALDEGSAPRRLFRKETIGLDMTTLLLERKVRVARLHGRGLTRLGLLRRHVVECGDSAYPYTAAWAQALWASRRRPHGISWTSRQSDSGRAYMLWEGRVPCNALTVASSGVPLDEGPGLEQVREACAAAGIDFDG